MDFPFDYDPLTGVILWKWRLDVPGKINTRFAGKPAGHINDEGYLRLEWHEGKIHRRHPAAMVIWAMMTGSFPVGEVDHVNRIPLDNRWANLRQATRSEQLQNRARCRPYPWPVGVKKRYNRFEAAIAVNKKQVYLGMFATPEAAHQAYLEARARLHPRRPDGPSTPDLG